MQTTTRWLNISILLFSLNTALQAFAPIGDPGMYPYITPKKVNLKLSQIQIIDEEDILNYATELNFFDPQLLLAVAKIESDLRPRVTSLYKGIKYYGLMQMSYGTAKLVGFKGHPSDLMNWKTNVRLAARYLEILHNEHGTKSKAVAAYNAGTVYYCKQCKDKSKVVNQEYVDKVMETYLELQGT